MTRHGSLAHLVLHGPDASFTARLLVTGEAEHLPDEAIGLLCTRAGPDGRPDATVMVTGALMHWSSQVLCRALPGDALMVAGRLEEVDAGTALRLPIFRVRNPAALEIWHCMAAGPGQMNTTGDRAA